MRNIIIMVLKNCNTPEEIHKWMYAIIDCFPKCDVDREFGAQNYERIAYELAKHLKDKHSIRENCFL